MAFVRGLTTLVAVSIATFALFFAVPADPAEALCGRTCPPQLVAATRVRLGLDRPVAVQYARFMGGIITGRTLGTGRLAVRCPAPCLGYSFRSGEPVTAILARGAPVTASVVAGGAVVWLSLGIGLGVLAGARRGTAWDRMANGLVLASSVVPIYLVGTVLAVLLVYDRGWLPQPAYVDPLADPRRWASGLLLPWLTLGISNAVLYARLTRASLIEAMQQDYLVTARGKGLPSEALLKHGFRATLAPLATTAGMDVGTALGGTVVTETTFGLNGLGRTAVDAAADRDLPVLMGTVLAGAVCVVVANLAADLLQRGIDPRLRRSG
jgi:peptide/nickel transport system permease protein